MIALLLTLAGGLVGASAGLFLLKVGRRKTKAREKRTASFDYVGILPPPVKGSIESQLADTTLAHGVDGDRP